MEKLSLQELQLAKEYYKDRLELVNGGRPIPEFIINPEKLKKITANCTKIAITGKIDKTKVLLKDILPGGIPLAHLHLENEIVLLDKAALQSYLNAAAEEVANIEDVTNVKSYIR